MLILRYPKKERNFDAESCLKYAFKTFFQAQYTKKTAIS